NVRDLMRHDARQLRFFVRVEDQAAVHVEEAAWQRESVHHIRIDHLDREGHARVRIAHQVLPDAIHVFHHHWIIDKFCRAVHLLRQLLAERDLVLQGIEVEALADVAIADGVNVILAARLYVRLVLLRERWLRRRGGLRRGSLWLRAWLGRRLLRRLRRGLSLTDSQSRHRKKREGYQRGQPLRRVRRFPHEDLPRTLVGVYTRDKAPCCFLGWHCLEKSFPVACEGGWALDHPKEPATRAHACRGGFQTRPPTFRSRSTGQVAKRRRIGHEEIQRRRPGRQRPSHPGERVSWRGGRESCRGARHYSQRCAGRMRGNGHRKKELGQRFGVRRNPKEYEWFRPA